MEFNKKNILDSINIEFYNSLKNLLVSAISILQESIIENSCIPTREVLKVTPFFNGYNVTSDVRPHLYSVVAREIWYLEELKPCSEIFNNNEILGSQGIDSLSVLFSFIEDYFDNIDPKSITFDQKHFDRLFEEYKTALLTYTYEDIYICPLLGFNSEVEILKLDENLTIRRITVDELNEIVKNSPFFNYGNFLEIELMNVKYVIEHRVSQIKKTVRYPSDNSISVAVFALRLLKKGKFLANNRLHRTLLPWEIRKVSVYGNNIYLNSPIAHDKYILSESEIGYLEKYYILSKNAQNLRSEKDYKQLFRAIDWFDRYHNELNIEHQYIFLMLLMEALCSGTPETLYKLSNRISLLIGKGDEDKLDVIEKFKELYKKRSIVHGHDVSIKEDNLLLAEDYSRRLLQKFIIISLNKYGTNDARTLLDQALISQKKRNELLRALDFDETCDLFNVESEKSEPLHALLKDELYEIKTEFDRDRFSINNVNKGFIYKLIIVNEHENTFDTLLWGKITEFYGAYFDYLSLLKKSRDRIREIIREVIHKIKTEEDATEWKRRYVENVKSNPSSLSVDAGAQGYNLNNLLKKNPPINMPEIGDDEYLSFDETSYEWDLKITHDDLIRSGRSMEDLLSEIHELLSREELISELKKSKIDNIKMLSSLIKIFK